MNLVTYLSPGGREGDVLKGVATCDKSMDKISPMSRRVRLSANNLAVGKTLAYTTVTFTNSKGQLAARGSHTK